jgi:hypothetical protein
MSVAGTKPTNPKDVIGVRKVSMSYVPAPVLMEVALGMMEGGFKYRRHNYRVAGVRSSIYYDATMRHLMAFWEGEDIDPQSGLPHLSKAMSSLVVWRDAQMQNKCADDRPPRSASGWIDRLNEHVEKLAVKYPNAEPPYTQVDEDAKMVNEGRANRLRRADALIAKGKKRAAKYHRQAVVERAEITEEAARASVYR